MNARGTELISGEKSLRGKSSTSRSRGLCLLAMPLPDALIEGYSGLFLSKEGIAATRCSWRVPKWSSMRIHIIVALLLFWCLPAHATTINAATCSQSDVQNAVNSASNGDTVRVPGPCVVAWASNVTVTGKGITVDGGGNTTITSSYAFNIQSSLTVSTRITGFIFTGSGNATNGDITTSGNKSNATFRIDHNTFTNASPTVIACYNNAPGLIDHNTFTGGGASEMIHNLAMGPSDTSGWTDDVTPGGSNMLFIEDNTFASSACTSNCSFLGTSAVQSYYGARTVFRHNTLNMAQVDQHGTAGNVGARWWEIYDNTFNIVSGGNQSAYMDLRAGSGVVFNNHQIGSTNLGAGNIILREEDTGYPVLYQIGRGVNEDYSPAYVWGNDSSMNVVSNSSNVQANRDFFVSTAQPASLVRCELGTDGGTANGLIGSCPGTYSYVPYPYPHPLQGASSVAAPTGLAAVVH